MRELALFAGVGGGLLGTFLAGFECVCAVEINHHARNVLKQRQKDGIFKPFEIHDDIHTFNAFNYANKIDIITGGFPCQAFSTAARGRNNAPDLWPEMLRVIIQIFPPFVFAENVSKKAIRKAANDLITMGYKAEAIELSAKDLGADHRRARYWLLAYSDDKTKLREQINAKTRVCSQFQESIWQSDSGMYGMVDGMADRMERIKAIGNGQVPSVVFEALRTLANN